MRSKILSIPAFLLVIAAVAGADSATQTSWTGGQGVPGPVGMPPGWAESFQSSSPSIGYSSIPGVLSLAYPECMIHPAATLAFTCGDLDGDDDIDVAAIDEGGNGYWLENAGSGTGWAMHSVPALTEIYQYSNTLEAADMDSDNDIDLFVSGDAVYLGWAENLDGSGLSWSYNDLSDTAIPPGYSALADVDGDLDIDVINCYGEYNHLTCLENLDGSGLLWNEHVLHSTGCEACCIADIDGDGDPDLAATSPWQAELRWYRNDGLDSWAKSGIATFNYPERVDACDIDADGDQDLVTTAVNENEVLWFENANGSGTSWNEHTIDATLELPEYVAADDFDGDGDGDVICGAGYLEDPLKFYENSGTGWIGTTLDPSSRAVVLSSDIDSDGTADALAFSKMYPPDWIKWWSMVYPGSGWLESSILYLGCDPGWGSIGWNSETPSGTSVSFQVRASDDHTQMGAWSGTLSAPCSLSGILADNASYLQYRALLASSEPDETPLLNDVTVLWNNLGTPEEEPPAGLELRVVSPNPSSGTMSIEFGLPQGGRADVTILDLAGRIAASETGAEYTPGWHSVRFADLVPGVYHAVVRACGSREAVRFTVME
ncbi:MAG: FG-GAP-like repeat-containing protein [Candidatus Fermentibacter sp.]|nr:FG-GAP-like repeat-containing protein [Candidatus Fermentibacter sp.]